MKDDKRLAFIRTLPCSVCQRPPSEAHHAIDIGLLPGMGKKADDDATMPLCHECHMFLHQKRPQDWIDAQLDWIEETRAKWAFAQSIN